MRISEATRPEGGDKLTFGDFNVFIGGNGVGKTTLLIELFAKATDSPRKKFYWVNSLAYESGNIKEDMLLLKSSLAKKYDAGNLHYYSRAIRNISGGIDLSDSFRLSSAEFEALDSQGEEGILNNLKHRRPFISFDSCEARLGLGNEVEITGLNEPPQDSINVLYRNSKLLKDIDKTVFERFGYKFILLDHNKRKLQLGLAKAEPPMFNNSADDAQAEFEKIEKAAYPP